MPRPSISGVVVLCFIFVLFFAVSNAYADTVTTFNVSGSATNISAVGLGSCASGATCSFSGTLTLDVTSGVAAGSDITFPGLSTFDVVAISGPLSTSNWSIFANDSDGALLVFDFSTSNTPGSLVGFTGGTILPGGVGNGSTPLYTITGGSITATPEPNSLAFLLLGVPALLLRRKRTVLPQAS